jgi:hypothetical protein
MGHQLTDLRFEHEPGYRRDVHAVQCCAFQGACCFQAFYPAHESQRPLCVVRACTIPSVGRVPEQEHTHLQVVVNLHLAACTGLQN